MKKLTLSIAALAAIGTFAVAGGDIAPVEPVVETPVVAPSDAGFYVGGAYGLMGMDLSNPTDPFSFDTSHDSFMLQAGYKINPYIAVEGRYWWGSSDDFTYGGTNYSADVDAWGIYVKPMYPVTDAFDVYALLGYGDTSPELNGAGPTYDTDGFQWGLGASYDVTSNVAVFVDYVNLYDDTNGGDDFTIDSWNFGVTYKF
ncbi:MAG: porin family protein [Sulfurovum sp.]|nr:porin family protein [Sulfurovum sp.]